MDTSKAVSSARWRRTRSVRYHLSVLVSLASYLILIVMNLDEEVRPYTTSAEREKTENLATLYSIIVSLEYLERAYVRDSVTGKEYVLFRIVFSSSWTPIQYYRTDL